MGWATFWAMFLITRLVTLAIIQFNACSVVRIHTHTYIDIKAVKLCSIITNNSIISLLGYSKESYLRMKSLVI
jgi:hypothetical protein